MILPFEMIRSAVDRSKTKQMRHKRNESIREIAVSYKNGEEMKIRHVQSCQKLKKFTRGIQILPIFKLKGGCLLKRRDLLDHYAPYATAQLSLESACYCPNPKVEDLKVRYKFAVELQLAAQIYTLSAELSESKLLKYTLFKYSF